MKRLMTALASIALIGTLFVGAPKPVFATGGGDTYYVGFGGGSDAGCGVPDYDLQYTEFEYSNEEYYTVPDGDDPGLEPDWVVAPKLEDAFYELFNNDGERDVTDGDTIVICDGWFHMHDNGPTWNGDLNPGIGVNPSTITIRGLGTGNTVIEGTDGDGDFFRPFYFTNTNLILEDMTIINTSSIDDGRNNNGGAIYLNYGSLEINDVDFVNFVAADLNGGAIALIDADLELNNVGFDKTTGVYPYNSDHNDGNGGAIYSTVSSSSVPNTTVSINNSEFTNLGTRDSGGALWLNCANTTINNSGFYDNTAGISGGAIWTNGADASCLTTSSFSVENSIFDGNYIHEDFGGEGGVGGAVASFGQPVTFIDSTVGSYGPGAGNWNNEGNGGGLFVDGTSGTLLTITDTDFFDNSSGWDKGGAVYAECANVVVTGDATGFFTEDAPMGGPIKSSNFHDNYARDNGGAIYLAVEGCGDGIGGTNDFVNATIDGVVFYGNDSNGQGGGIASSQSGWNWLNLLDIENSSFVYNSSVNSTGGAVNVDYSHVNITESSFYGNFADDGGGAVEICGGNLTITGSGFFENGSWSDGGAIELDDGCGRPNGGNLTVVDSSFDENGAGNDAEGGAIYVNYGNQTVTITNSEFTDNTSGSNGGAAVFEDATTNITRSDFDGNRAGGHGGAIHLSESNSLTVRTSTFTDNSSGYEGGSYDGGAIDFYADDNDAYFGVFDSVFEGNYGTEEGGAIWFSLNEVGVGGLLEIFRTSFIQNTSDESGGAIDVSLGSHGTLTVDRSTFTDNVTWVDGGAINQDTQDRTTGVRITNSSFIGNFAYSDGGALDLTDRTLLANNLFVGNMTSTSDDGDGGAAELNRNNPDNSLPYLHIVTNNTFRDNHSDDDGGAVATTGRTLVTGNTFEKNTAEDDGGALELGSGDGHMVSGNRFTDNVSEDDGGAVEAEDDVVVSSNVFTNNYAEDNGGALSVDDEARITKNTFINNRSDDNGGAIYADDLGFPESSITDNLFQGNSAGEQGGAMWIDDDEGVMDHKVVIASNRVIRNTAKYGAGIYVTFPDGSTSSTQLMSGIIRNSFERNVASLNGGGIMMEYRGGTFSNARAALAALKKAAKNNRYKANKANLDRATGDIGGWAFTGVMVGALEEVEAVKAPEAPSVR